MKPAGPAHCLVVDDEPRLREVLVRVLAGAGHVCRDAGSGREAVRELEREAAELVISDIHMPEMDGTELLAAVRDRWPDTGVVMITAVSDVETAVRCLQRGALDYILKPFQVEEVLVRVAQALEKRRLILENREYQLHLEERVREQARRIEEMFVQAVQALAHALEAKDAYTRGHSRRVAIYAAATAAEMGLGPETVEEMRLGAELHDVGKIGVREAVLFKPGRLTEEEYLHIMEHTLIGERILTPLLADHPLVLRIVRSHHERLDGHGFPDHLKGDAIPLVARVVAVADAFDAMTSGRPYRKARSPAGALAELRRCVGTQLEGAAVAAFQRAFPEGSQLPVAAPATLAAPAAAVPVASSR